jgi:UDP-glucose 4-epimerase
MKHTDKILVTGSSGFIGSHLMRTLGKRGIPFDIKKSKYMDINNADALRTVMTAFKPFCIIHLAAVSSRQAVDNNPTQALKTNIVGTFNILRLAKKYGIRVILASSAATYEPEMSLYGTSKQCMESLALMFDNAIIARFFNVYGKGSKSVVNKFSDSIKNGREIILNGNTKRDYIHVVDIVTLLLRLAKNDKPGKLYEFGTGVGTSLKQLVSQIEKVTKKKAKVNQGKAIHEIQESCCSSNLSELLPMTKLKDGIGGLL